MPSKSRQPRRVFLRAAFAHTSSLPPNPASQALLGMITLSGSILLPLRPLSRRPRRVVGVVGLLSSPPPSALLARWPWTTGDHWPLTAAGRSRLGGGSAIIVPTTSSVNEHHRRVRRCCPPSVPRAFAHTLQPTEHNTRRWLETTAKRAGPTRAQGSPSPSRMTFTT